MPIQNRLAEIRRQRGLSVVALAGQVDVGRQTIYAIEAGTYIPNTAVALRLAHVLGVSVEEVFSLAEQPAVEQTAAEVELLGSAAPLQPGQSVRLCRVGKKLVGIPSAPLPEMLPPADAVCVKSGRTRAVVHPLSPDEELGRRVLIAGCDPAVSVLGRFLAQQAGIELIPANCSSMQAIEWLAQDKVHIAGSHLRDPKTGESNLPMLKKRFPGGGYKIVTFAEWEQGLVVARGNPKQIRGAADLARKGVRFVNREKGAGSRFLLDELLEKAGVDAVKVRGYNQLASGHIPAAWQVYSGDADCCVATRAAARSFGLDFLPLTMERYDLIIREGSLAIRSVEILLDVLQHSAFRHALETLANYNMAQSGRTLV